jgi:hypothetical protein
MYDTCVTGILYVQLHQHSVVELSFKMHASDWLLRRITEVDVVEVDFRSNQNAVSLEVFTEALLPFFFFIDCTGSRSG